MDSLRDFFHQNAYAVHRASLRRERLPDCCRSEAHLLPTKLGIRFLNRYGQPVILPVFVCSVCGKRYAGTEDRFLPIASLLRYETVEIPSPS